MRGKIHVAPRFVKEFKNYQKRAYSGVDDCIIRAEALGALEGIFRACDKGFITPAEAMRLLSAPLDELIK